jgi:hypothetical protein
MQNSQKGSENAIDGHSPASTDTRICDTLVEGPCNTIRHRPSERDCINQGTGMVPTLSSTEGCAGRLPACQKGILFLEQLRSTPVREPCRRGRAIDSNIPVFCRGAITEKPHTAYITSNPSRKQQTLKTILKTLENPARPRNNGAVLTCLAWVMGGNQLGLGD